MPRTTPGLKQAGQAVKNAETCVARFAIENAFEIDCALEADGKPEAAKELRELLAQWKRCTENFLAECGKDA